MTSPIDCSGSVRPAPVRLAPARLVTLLALCGAMLLAVLLALPAPAQAHDTLLSSDPEDGASLETSPEAIAFTFSADVLEVSPLVRISDESGAELAEIVPTVDGPVATATLDQPLPAGAYTIQWRVVSSDGHPIEGTQTLTVEQDPAEQDAAEPIAPSGGGAEESATSASDAGGAESSEPAADDSTAQEQDTSASAPDEEGGISMGALIGILAVIAVGAAIAVYFIVRRRD